MKKIARIILLGAAIACIFALPAGAEEARYKIPLEDSPFIGPADAPITVFEFLDYQ